MGNDVQMFEMLCNYTRDEGTRMRQLVMCGPGLGSKPGLGLGFGRLGLQKTQAWP